MTDKAKRNKTIGTVMMIVGALLMAVSLFITIRNLSLKSKIVSHSDKALTAVSEIINLNPATSNDDPLPPYIQNPNIELPSITVDGTHYIGTIHIPTLGVLLPVADRWDDSFLTPGRYYGSLYRNNMVITASAISDHFGGLIDLEDGSQLIFTDVNNRKSLFVLLDKLIVEPGDVEEAYCKDCDLTLFTATASGNRRVIARFVLFSLTD